MLETVVAKIREEKIKKAIDESISKGIAIGKQESILNILRKKFTEIPNSIETKIKGIRSVEKLENILLSILDISSIEELKKYL